MITNRKLLCVCVRVCDVVQEKETRFENSLK